MEAYGKSALGLTNIDTRQRADNGLQHWPQQDALLAYMMYLHTRA